MKISMTPGMVRLAEELTIQRTAEHVTNAIATLRQTVDYADMIAQSPAHADEARLRAQAYEAAAQGFEKLWTSTLAVLEQISKVDEAVAEAVAKAEAERPDDFLEAASVAMRAAQAAASGAVSLCCPKCQTGRWVAPDGTCATCGETAVDLVKIGNGEPGVPPTAEPPEHGGEVVPIQKRDRGPRR